MRYGRGVLPHTTALMHAMFDFLSHWESTPSVQAFIEAIVGTSAGDGCAPVVATDAASVVYDMAQKLYRILVRICRSERILCVLPLLQVWHTSAW